MAVDHPAAGMSSLQAASEKVEEKKMKGIK